MTRRRALITGGAGMLLAGLLVLGYVVWQVYGTTAVSQQRQSEAVERTELAWDTHGATELHRAPATALVRIPRFGDDYVVPVVEGVDEDVLDDGLGHFEGTAEPGDVGNFALAGHRITHGQPLRRMPDLQPGDQVVVETRDAVHTYELDTDAGELVVDDDADWVLEQEAGQRTITLITCAELFHTDKRMVAFGHLVSSTPK